MKALTVRQLFTLYHGEQSSRVKAGTLTHEGTLSRRRYAELFCGFVGADKVADAVGQGELLAFLAEHPEWESPHTKNDVASAIVGAFRWATTRRYLEVCPISKPRGFWLPPRPRKAIRPEAGPSCGLPATAVASMSAEGASGRPRARSG